ncbi:hypothetical protein ACTA71_010324 [Dictyostelium dimigraforme]
MDTDNQLIQSNEENMNVHRESNNESQESGSHGSNNSIDTVINSRDEEEYVKRLLEDNKERLSIIRRVQLLEIRNIQLHKECRVKELKEWKFKIVAVLIWSYINQRVLFNEVIFNGLLSRSHPQKIGQHSHSKPNSQHNGNSPVNQEQLEIQDENRPKKPHGIKPRKVKQELELISHANHLTGSPPRIPNISFILPNKSIE